MTVYHIYSGKCKEFSDMIEEIIKIRGQESVCFFQSIADKQKFCSIEKSQSIEESMFFGDSEENKIFRGAISAIVASYNVFMVDEIDAAKIEKRLKY